MDGKKQPNREAKLKGNVNEIPLPVIFLNRLLPSHLRFSIFFAIRGVLENFVSPFVAGSHAPLFLSGSCNSLYIAYAQSQIWPKILSTCVSCLSRRSPYCLCWGVIACFTFLIRISQGTYKKPNSKRIRI